MYGHAARRMPMPTPRSHIATWQDHPAKTRDRPSPRQKMMLDGPRTKQRRSSQLLSDTGDDFWGVVAKGFGQDTGAFKAAVIKDNETLALIGALTLTICFSMLHSDFEDGILPVRLAYILTVAVATSSSLLCTVLSVRTILLVNSGPSSETLALMRGLAERRKFAHIHPFNLMRATLYFMLCASTIRTYVEYGVGCTIVLGTVFAFTGWLFLHEDEIHYLARMEVQEPDAQVQSWAAE